MKWDHSVGANLPSVPFREATRESPAGHPAVVYVTLPLGAGLVMFFGTGLLALAFHWSVRVAYGVAGMSICVVFALLTVMLWSRPLIYSRESVIGPATPLPALEAPSHPVVTLDIRDSESEWEYPELPGTPEQLMRLAEGIEVLGLPFAEEEWSGTGKPYSRDDFRQLRKKCFERGFVTWKSDKAHTQGCVLTRKGHAVFAALAGVRPSAYVRDGTIAQLEEGEVGE